MNKSKLDRIPLANEKSMAENHCATISFCVRERECVPEGTDWGPEHCVHGKWH